MRVLVLLLCYTKKPKGQRISREFLCVVQQHEWHETMTIFNMVDRTGFEPVTSSMPWKRSANSANGPCQIPSYFKVFSLANAHFRSYLFSSSALAPLVASLQKKLTAPAKYQFIFKYSHSLTLTLEVTYFLQVH